MLDGLQQRANDEPFGENIAHFAVDMARDVTRDYESFKAAHAHGVFTFGPT